LKERFTTNVTKKTEAASGGNRQSAEKADKKEISRSEKRCFNCGQRSHLSIGCPTKAEVLKCFGCGKRGHIASKCKEQKIVSNTNIVKRSANKKYTKEVLIGK